MTQNMTTPSRMSIRTLAKISVMGALAAILMYFEFPLPFAPSFMGVDFSDIPVLLVGYALGPVNGMITAFVKIVVKLLLKPTSTMFIGELSNLFLTLVYVLVAAIYYRRHRTMKGAIISLVLATISVSLIAFASNGFVIYPLYASLLNQNIDGIIKLTASLNGLVSNYWTMMLFMVIPFNLVKYTAVSLVTCFMYKYVSPLLKR